MRRFAFACAVAVWLCAVAATPASAQAPEDSVTGGGFGFRFSGSYDAHSGPSGENPTGTASIGFRGSVVPPIFIRGRVLCLTVIGNRAVIGIDGSLNNTLPPPAQGALIEVIDGGGQNDTQGFTPLSAPPTACPSTFTTPQDQVLSGDLVVTDSQPPAGLPTSKEQCKDGGWRNFGDTFKNQGQCVAFVQRGPKP